MSLVISHNFAASYAARQLEINDDNLRNSLNKLSSGKRIVRPTDDAAGMAVQLKMKAAINRGFAAKNNIQNAISLLQTQDGVLTTASAVVDRIGELRAMSTDATKNSLDLLNYDEEFQVLREQLIDLQDEKFNGVRLFVADSADHDKKEAAASGGAAGTDGVFTIYTTEQGNATSAPTVDFEGVHLGNDGVAGTIGGIIQNIVDDQYDSATVAAGEIGLTNLSMDNILADLQSLANARAKNGALQSRLGYAYDNASVSKSNMEAARSRIIDVDIAEESTKFATYNILTQASASILAQANQTGRTALQLLMN
jgi:flagellin